MKPINLYQIADEIAPFALSKEYCERYGAYDNSGVVLDFGEELTGVVFSLDCSTLAIEEAKKQGANCILPITPQFFHLCAPFASAGRLPILRLAQGRGSR